MTPDLSRGLLFGGQRGNDDEAGGGNSGWCETGEWEAGFPMQILAKFTTSHDIVH